VYTYWDKLGVSDIGVIEFIKRTAELNNQHSWLEDIQRDVRFWKSSRIYGDFYILLGTLASRLLNS